MELPSYLSKLLCSHEVALDIVSLHVSVSKIMTCALLFLSDYDCETVGSWIVIKSFAVADAIQIGDPQTAVSHLGVIVLFVQSTLARFQACGHLVSGSLGVF